MSSSDLHLIKMFSALDEDVDFISNNTGGAGDRVQQLRQLLLSQLDLIQKQSEVILARDQQIKELRRENEDLSKKIQDLSTCTTKASKKAKIAKAEQNIKEEQEIIQNNEEFEEMQTEKAYFTLQNNLDFVNQEDIKDSDNKEEIPGWRLKPIAPSYAMEGTENIEDETILKRHQKHENDEKRRKRWDVQRIREQRHVARLRARYDEPSSTAVTADNSGKEPILSASITVENKKETMATLVPNPYDDAESILVQDKLPVSVFGCVLPNLGNKEFTLPWL